MKRSVFYRTFFITLRYNKRKVERREKMEHTIAAISTATGEAGIGIVRMSGKNAFSIADSVFSGKRNKEDNRKLLYGHIVDGDQIVDEVLISFMRGPKTYTTEDIVEIYTHGGIISVRKVLELLLERGAELAQPGEFTKRAFLNGRLDLSQAEAVIDMISAKTEKSYEASLSQLEGSMKHLIGEFRKRLLDLLSYIEYSINFTEDLQEELSYEPILEKGQALLEEMSKLRDSSNRGRMIKEGIHMAILGKPNVGKSSLLNALIRENKAIVTDIPGTTRDVVEESIDLNGIVLRISDTAGIRESEDLVESLGIERSKEIIKDADLLLTVFDASKELDEEDEKILSLLKDKKVIILLNKTDLGCVIEKTDERFPQEAMIIEMSIKERKGIDILEESILDLFFQGEIIPSQEDLVTNIRHREILERSIESLEEALNALEMGIPVDLLEVDLRNAWTILGEITGETIDDDVLDRIFEDFCIGK